MSHFPLIALVGNPNAGKSTLFNALTGSSQSVGNYPGITVDLKQATTRTPHGKEITIVDLPGCYSLSSSSPDKALTAEILRGESATLKQPDLAICVVDASALERHLRLVLETMELGLPVVIALNMVDLAEKQGLRLDPLKLSEELGVPVVPMQASTKRGLIELKQALRLPYPQSPELKWTEGENVESSRRELIARVCQLSARRPDTEQQTLSDKLDSVLLHPVFGWIFFAAIFYGIFWSIFSFASIPMDFIDGMTGQLASIVENAMPPGDLRSLIVDGMIAGVGGVIIFLPQIVLLFLFIGLIESSGYMARAAFLMDGVMAKAGLSGKAFLPLFSSFACAIPGVMAARTVDSAKERLATIFVAPWMSCSARLPVYFLIIPLLIGDKGSAGLQATILTGVYAVGIITAAIVARLLRKRLGEEAVPKHFMLELPAYRAPQWGYTLRHVASRAGAFVRKAGTIILGLSILLWALSTYPKPPENSDQNPLSHSAMGHIGRVIEPIVKPLGFDGKMGTAILTSFAAREVFVSSMAILYQIDEEADEDQTQLRQTLREEKWSEGRKKFTPLTLVSLLIFFIYALQCLPTSAVVARETGSWKWAIGQFVFMTAFAYLASLAVFQTGKLLGF